MSGALLACGGVLAVVSFRRLSGGRFSWACASCAFGRLDLSCQFFFLLLTADWVSVGLPCEACRGFGPLPFGGLFSYSYSYAQMLCVESALYISTF